jgi:hypothetical protein
MVDLKKIDLDKNEVTYDNFDTVTHDQFYNAFVQHWNNRIAGETLSPVHVERFMKRTSTKNSENLIRGKKVEGYMEGRFGKKMDPAWIKIVLIVGIVAFIGILAAVVAQKLGYL